MRVVLLICLFCGLVGDEAYVQISSSVTQKPSPEAQNGTVLSWDDVELNKNFGLSADNTMIICQIPGLYLVAASYQPGTTARGVNGYLDAWFEVNGKPVAGTNTRQTVSQDNSIANMTNSYILRLNKGDVFTTKILSSQKEVGTIALPNKGSNEPSITSFLLSLLKIE